MATVEITVQFSSKLECGKCDDVLIEVYDPTKIASNTGIVLPEEIQHFIPGTITDFTCVGSHLYQYDISYDDALLTKGTVLTECDIKRVCCAGCVLSYFNTLIARLEAAGP